jgi:multidrug resistance efflux pump
MSEQAKAQTAGEKARNNDAVDADDTSVTDGNTADGSKAEPTPEAMASPPKKTYATRSTLMIMAVLFLVGVAIIAWAWNLWPFRSDVQTTNNSYVRGQVTVLSSQVNGYVAKVEVNDYQHVRAGDVLFRIDDRTYSQQVHQAEAQLAAAVAQRDNSEQTTAQNRASIYSAEAGVAQADAEVERASNDLTRVTTLNEKNVSTQRELDQARATARSAEASARRARAELETARQTLRSTEVSKSYLEANVESAKASLELARINLSNTVIRAPRDGQVSEASARPGQFVSSGSQLTYLVPDRVWVVANFKETQTSHMAVGDPVRFTVDGVDDARFTGKVEVISPATGSEFSVLRPDNASGNFTKVVQRLPVRIAIDSYQPNAERLRPGMSVVAHVDTTAGQAVNQGRVPIR